jgi:2-keto-4-pentenoate hydratase/2-oxohepta-3-ene-1,7-dioic acid hydratase in catechol pathway
VRRVSGNLAGKPANAAPGTRSDDMDQRRRKFLQAAGVAAVAAVGGARVAAAEAPKAAPKGPPQKGLARGLTLLHLRHGDGHRLAVKTPQGLLDVVEASAILGLGAPATIDDLLQNEDGPRLNALVAAALQSRPAARAFRPEQGAAYGPIVTRPEKIVCMGHNYRKHVEEVKAPMPKVPVLFSKFNTALNHHLGTVKLPTEVAVKFDHEVELVLVVGRTARNVAEAEALGYLAGYATGNDFTARDLQYDTGGQWLSGKALDGFAPVGPYLVTADQVDPDNLKIECRVNGETRQSSSTADFIFNTRKMVSYISRLFTLKPGDIIYTGTPSGVIAGKPKDQQVWLKAGDEVACSLEGLGELRFTLA